mmetsp:Transcript_7548/g.8241  ORF Transcript_7548/g.8241 Transcript_7548/m.8241 type:complete len:324 (+) Transcript_7548:150-1121(+)
MRARTANYIVSKNNAMKGSFEGIAFTSKAQSSHGGKKRPTTTLKHLLLSQSVEIMSAAHNSLAAKLMAQAGAKAIWASDLKSCVFSMKNNDGVLDAVEAMTKESPEPILVHGERHWFESNRNLPAFVRKLERRGIAGLTLNESYFLQESFQFKPPGRFLDQLAHFESVIAQCKAGPTDTDFQIIAELESLQTGWDQGEMLRRAESYRQAGADAILIPFGISDDPYDLESFVREWNNRHPLVVLPSGDSVIPFTNLKNLDISMIVRNNEGVKDRLNELQVLMREMITHDSLSEARKISENKKGSNLDQQDSIEESEDKDGDKEF